MTVLEWIHYGAEISYFICGGPLLLACAFLGLKQITVTKKVAADNAKREALRIAAEWGVIYEKELIPTISKYKEETKGWRFLNDSKVTVNGNKMTANLRCIDLKNKRDLDLIEKAILVINRLESFSMHFLTGLADDEYGYIIAGHAFCSNVEFLLPVIALSVRAGDDKPTTLHLYAKWKGRLEKEKLLAEKRRIDDKLNKTFNMSV